MGRQSASPPTQHSGPHPDPKWTYPLAYSHVSGAEAGPQGRGQWQSVQKGEGPLYKVGVECGQKVDPHDVPALIFLSGQDIRNEVVPVEEPLLPENIQDCEH